MPELFSKARAFTIRKPIRASQLLRALLLCLVTFITACAEVQHQTHLVVESQLRADKPEAALQTLEKQSLPAKTTALYFLNKAMVLRHMGEYEQSTTAFEKAKAEIGRLSATSITESLAAYTVTEQFNSYQAPTYERLFVHIYQIMNYLALGNLEAARVEALQIDVALNRLTEVNLYQEAACARYITGLVFEANQEPDEAFIAYQQAFANYERGKVSVPRDLQLRLASLAKRLGVDLGQTLTIDIADTQPPQQAQGQIVILADIDFAPRKIMSDTSVMDPQSGNIVRVSLPHYQPRLLDGVTVTATLNQQSFNAEDFANIEAIAIDELHRRMPSIVSKTISRNISKNSLANQVKEENQILGQIVSIVGAALEQADTRHWLTLPNKIEIASQTLPPGNYSLAIDILDRRQQTLKHKSIENIEIKPNQLTFINVSWQHANTYPIH
ncbi:hypothetical protein TDB9533_02617 [Thalassocella blandensis]|nr:hypothetical protein TDB9533_02617 [Thalassocella blandensis]